jgi:hypothetical protein
MKKTAIILIIALALATFACDDKPDNGKDEETPIVPQPATITQDNGLAFTGKVTIKTSDQYLKADWDAVVAKVIAALNRGYGTGSGGNSAVFGDVFNQDYGFDIVVIVLKSASHNIEVKKGEYGKLYLKESSLDTLSANNVKDAVWIMGDGLGGTDGEYHANATPAKDRVFLA